MQGLAKKAEDYFSDSIGFNAVGLGSFLWLATVGTMALQTAHLSRALRSSQWRDTPSYRIVRRSWALSIAVLVLTVLTLISVCVDFALNRSSFGFVTIITIALGSTAVFLQIALLSTALVDPAYPTAALHAAVAVVVLQQVSNAVQLAAIFNKARFIRGVR